MEKMNKILFWAIKGCGFAAFIVIALIWLWNRIN